MQITSFTNLAQTPGKIYGKAATNSMAWIDCIDNEKAYVLPFMEKLINFCKFTKFVPKEIKESAKKYNAIEFTFNSKWGGVKSKDNFVFWKDAKEHENYNKDEKELFAARKNFLAKFNGWAKNLKKIGHCADYEPDEQSFRKAYDEGTIGSIIDLTIYSYKKEKKYMSNIKNWGSNLKKIGRVPKDMSSEKLIDTLAKLYVLQKEIDTAWYLRNYTKPANV